MEKIIFFDGVCNLCSSSVQFIIKKDKNKIFKFASLQSNFSEQKLKAYLREKNSFDSVVLWENGKIHVKSTAALLIAKQLSGMWKLCYAFIIIPTFIRDWVYNIIAKNRYAWFGKKESCWLPTPEMKERFIES